MPTVDTSSLGEWMQASWGKLTVGQLLGTAAILLICLAVSQVLMKLLRRLAAKSDMDDRIRLYVLKGVRGLLHVLTALIVADSLGIPVTSLVALVGVFGLAISLAVQDMLSNVAGGLVILLSKPFALGDYVSAGGGEGTVSEITLTHTKLDTPGGQRVMLPNSGLVAGQIVNYSVRGVRRADLTVSASYDDSAEAVRSACLRAVGRMDGILADPAPAVVLTNYGESAIEYHVRFWTRTEDYWPAVHGAMEEILRCFTEDGVTMTYNHLNVHILEKTQEK